jgi:hypothetical protein
VLRKNILPLLTIPPFVLRAMLNSSSRTTRWTCASATHAGCVSLRGTRNTRCPRLADLWDRIKQGATCTSHVYRLKPTFLRKVVLGRHGVFLCWNIRRPPSCTLLDLKWSSSCSHVRKVRVEKLLLAGPSCYYTCYQHCHLRRTGSGCSELILANSLLSRF